jgi:hypothetical protein
MTLQSFQSYLLDHFLCLAQELFAGGQQHFLVLALDLDLKWQMIIINYWE